MSGPYDNLSARVDGSISIVVCTDLDPGGLTAKSEGSGAENLPVVPQQRA